MSDAPQPVGVAALLCRELSGAAGGPPRVKLSAEDPLLAGYVAGGRGARSPYRYGQGMVLALETLGLLTLEETAAWSRRACVGRLVKRRDKPPQVVVGQLALLAPGGRTRRPSFAR